MTIPAAVMASRDSRQADTARALGVTGPRQILFGDFHVHTTLSSDAFIRSLPIYMGEGAHPLADACDFARFCSSLDFWSINDHAESLTPLNWLETKESIRQCNAVAGDPQNPDMVSFLGWEWTQMTNVAETYYGHRNVILKNTAEDTVPTRPIGAPIFGNKEMFRDVIGAAARRVREPLLDFSNRQVYFDLYKSLDEWVPIPACPEGVPVRQLPAECMETVATPGELFARLDEWALPAIVIPHGNAWGLSVLPGSSWDHQLNRVNYDPVRQPMIEIYSGHGNSEEYRPWRAVGYDDEGRAVCPEPAHNYRASCWRAGEIIHERCLAAGFDSAECELRAAEARQRYVDGGIQGYLTVPGQQAEEWLDAGQCRDCFLPVFNLRPGYSTQYALAISNFDDPKQPLRHRFAFVGSSDSHRGRPGVGYKEFSRHEMTDAQGPRDAAWQRRLGAPQQAPQPRSIAMPAEISWSAFTEAERRAGFLTTGGLVAVHATGRNRDAIWAALQQREVYATSGPRILLWFELLNGVDGPVSMGGETAMDQTPRFRARAAGSFRQKPGCPDIALNALPPERRHALCRSECYHPSDERLLIRRIEVIRIRPQLRPGEPVDTLIEAPWKSFACAADSAGCTVEWDDPEYTTGARDTVYYVRAIQEPTPKINGGNLRCEIDEDGNCISVNLCTGGYPTPYEDDCLNDAEERAWSSPIFVDYPRS